MPREVIIAGNWKMHKNSSESKDFLSKFAPAVSDTLHTVCLAVPFPLISDISRQAKNSKIQIGAQNMHDAEEGAYTGEVSAKMLLDAGAEFVILGHSERRHIFGEDNAFVNRKLKRALESGIRPVLCVGETEEERGQEKTEAVLKKQLSESLADLSSGQISQVVFAYEPVWAIGTGFTATPGQAQAAHAFCRSVILSLSSEEVSKEVSILYGGSVKPENVREIMEQTDVDGVLVGGASLKPEAFAQIVNYQTMKV